MHLLLPPLLGAGCLQRGDIHFMCRSHLQIQCPYYSSLSQLLEPGLWQSLFELYLLCRPKTAFPILPKAFPSSMQSLGLPSNRSVGLEHIHCNTAEPLYVFPVSLLWLLDGFLISWHPCCPLGCNDWSCSTAEVYIELPGSWNPGSIALSFGCYPVQRNLTEVTPKS